MSAVRHLISALLVIVGVIHLMPAIGVLGAARLESLYGVAIVDPNLAILMRHRAVLFALLGAFVLIAAFRPRLQGLAIVGGLVSVVSFMWLAWSTGGYNEQVSRVVVADVVALACLVACALARVRQARGAP